MLMNIFVVILCLLMLGAGVFGFCMENIGPKKKEGNDIEQKAKKENKNSNN